MADHITPHGLEALQVIDDFIDLFGIGNHSSMAWKRSLCDDGIEMVHHDGDTIFFGDPNHKEPADTERFDLIVRLVNALPAIRAAIANPEPAGAWDDLSRELTAKRRALRRRMLELGDDDLRYLYYETMTLAEHEAGRRAVNQVLSRSHLSNRAEA